MDITLTSLWGLASGLLFIYDVFGALTEPLLLSNGLRMRKEAMESDGQLRVQL